MLGRRICVFAVVTICFSRASLGQALPECNIDFEGQGPGNCPNAGALCGATFVGGNGCLFEMLPFCYSSGLFSYKITPSSPLTITLSGDLNSLELFFAHQGTATGTMRFFDAVAGGNEVGPPLTTNGNCLALMAPLQMVSFDTPIRRIEVSVTGAANTAAWIDDFHVNPGAPIQDCNMNMVPDDQDIADGTSLDCNSNMMPDECEFPGCPGIVLADMNCDGLKDGADIRRFVETFVSGVYTCQADMDQDGAVGESDVAMFVAALLT